MREENKKRGRLKSKKFLIGGVIVIAAIAFLLYRGLGLFSFSYVTVDEFYRDIASFSGKNVQVKGTVEVGSLKWDGVSEARFTLAEKGASLPVVYKGILPDTFAEGGEAVVEGTYDSTRFVATKVLAKCPSRYVPAR